MLSILHDNKDGKVTFRWRDYRDGNQIKLMTLDVFRRFLLHILPANFVKIRHYGILSNRNRLTKLKKCQAYLKVVLDNAKPKLKTSWEDLLFLLTGVNPRNCPVCGQGKMVAHEIIHANTIAFFKGLRDKFTINGNLAIESP